MDDDDDTFRDRELLRCSNGGRNLLVISLRVSSRMSALALMYSAALFELVLVLRVVGAGLKSGLRGGASRPSCPAAIGRGITRSIFPVFMAACMVLSSAMPSFPVNLRLLDSLVAAVFALSEILPFRCEFVTGSGGFELDVLGSFKGMYCLPEFALEMAFSCFCATFFSRRS